MQVFTLSASRIVQPDVAPARAWYAGPDYQAALRRRLQGSTVRMHVIEGTDAPPKRVG